ncbi:MAG: aspartate aminotransferase family protein [Sporocytophaga sp.]|uniref:aspartate aminotransferase family protein n=1 Tax=Sporocytophaga sp. TaxID=2231183 RepID=UPI001B17ABDB|nr:aspartate aminotransferase family protein [Sporocytophaga sp.]MBO9700736.1 aspartate aminotransferase family protein [Sporocytophaga sp.]
MSQRHLFLQYLAQTSDAPLMLEIEKAEGVKMFDKNGKAYIDLISGIGVSNVGHRHPKVIQAVKDQLDKYLHLMVYGEFIQSPQVKLAEALVKTLPPGLDNVYFVNSGSEAVEGAIKLAKRVTGRYEIISFKNAYHGSTTGSLALNGNEYFKQAFRPLMPGIRHLNYNKEEDLEFITTNTSAVIVESIQGEAGVRVPENNFLKKLRVRCSETGTLLIVDEIQAGFGRTGTFWGFENFDIIPDIVVCAKGMGGGMPIGAFIAPKELMKELSLNPVLGHITTFGGHPVSCAAALATVNIVQEEKLSEQVSEKEKLFIKLLQHPLIHSVRHKGLMMAVEMESFEILKKTIDKAIMKGVLTDWFLFCDNAMRIAPPLVINEEEIKVSCNLILETMDEIQKD